MKIKLQLSYSEREALDAIVNNLDIGIKASEIAVAQLTVFNLGLDKDFKQPIILTLNDLQSRLYKNKSNDYNFLFKWKHEVIEQ